MARVNDGAIAFQFSGVTNDELLGQVLESIHTSSYYARLTLDDIFHRNAKFRTSYHVDSSDEPKVDEPEWQNTLLSNMKADYLFKSVMGTISMFNDLMSKKAVLIILMKSGYHIDYPNEFKLVTDLKSNNISEFDLQRMNNDNETLNEIIRSFTYDAIQKADAEFSKVIEYIRDKYGAALADTIMTDLGLDIYRQSAYNIRTKIYGYCVDEDKKNYIPQIDTDGEMNRDDVVNDIMNVINTSRAVVLQLFEPDQKILYPVFSISESSFRSYKKSAMNQLVKSYGINLCREVINNG